MDGKVTNEINTLNISQLQKELNSQSTEKEMKNLLTQVNKENPKKNI